MYGFGLNKNRVDISSSIVDAKTQTTLASNILYRRRDSLPRRQKKNKADTCPTIFGLETRLEIGVGAK